MNAGQRRHRHARWLLPGLLCTGGAFAVVHLTSDTAGRTAVMAMASLGSMVGVTAGLRINRIADKRHWLIGLLGLGLLTGVNAISFVQVGVGGAERVNSPVSPVLQAAGYVALLAASVVVVFRHAPQDSGGVIDAALIGVGAASPLWEFSLRPQLHAAGWPTGAQIVVLVQLLALLATLGALLRISRTTAWGRGSLRYLFASLGSTVAGLVLSIVATDPTTGRSLPYVGLCWIAGYLCLGAAVLHPSAADFTVPGTWRRDELSPVRFGYLGLCLLLTPVVGGIPQLFGHPPDGLLLCVGPLLSVPLVLARIQQLIQQHRHDQQRLAHQASQDELTGLPNRRQVFTLLDAALRAGDRHVTVLFCDLNDFKPVNDRFGHEAGDQVLRTVAERLRACVRADDVVGRIGGDEFLVVCPGAGSDDVDATRSRIERALATPVSWRDEPVRVGVAIGVAVAPAGAETTAGSLVAAADQAMYAEKRASKPFAGTVPVDQGQMHPV
ncbi:GGDEF domain-containing protein [Micromonospora sp. NPDC049679]|uniref:GGDEF domain-containing protein n=1 Tax=Micromonospora sp. NPDC049679 TaxID=3155920 RepID=UPI00340554FC